MLRISEKHINALRRAETVATVRDALASAIQLELATIPVYLTALFSLKQNGNRAAGALVQGVVVEEMAHLTLAANTLIAIGGTPRIAAAGHGLHFPGPLPLGIDDGLHVSLGALTRQHVHDVFMAIERPDTAHILPGELAPNPPPSVPGEYASIGDFYGAIIDALARLERSGAHCFAEPRLDRQVDIAAWFPPIHGRSLSGLVDSLASATAALETIVVQGEGAPLDEGFTPLDGTGESYAHYFMFGEIFHGRRLVPDPAAPSGWSYAGNGVPLDESMVYPLLQDAALSDYAPGSGAQVAGQQFYDTYQRLLRTLDTVFNGAPAMLDAAMGIMYELKLAAQKVVRHPAGPDRPDLVAAPPFMLTRAR